MSSGRGPFWLGSEIAFPDPHHADEHGLLAVGGDLSPERLIAAYGAGIFPWPLDEPGAPLLWFSPDPRFVLFPEDLHLSRSLMRTLRQQPFELSFDEDFEGVVRGCATASGRDVDGTWITEDVIHAYARLHRRGRAHSMECRDRDRRLVGGVYGVSLGAAFFAESMFHRVSNASKVALVALVQVLASAGFRLFDCQQETPHVAAMGARSVPRSHFLSVLADARAASARPPAPGPLSWGTADLLG